MHRDDDPADLVRAATAGDASAWSALVERYSGLLWSIAATYRLDRADSADAIQTTWLHLLENLDRLHDPGRVCGWLATTLRHECSATLRRGGRAVPTDEAVLEAAVDAKSHGPSPDASLLLGERDRLVWAAFERLTRRCREVLRILVAYVEEAPHYADAALVLDIPMGSLGPTRGRCLQRLRDYLGELGVESAGDSV